MTKFSRLDELLERFVENGPPGCALQIQCKGKKIYENFIGYADLEKEKRIQENTIYRIYSMSKVVTCVAALTLYEKGAFLLNDRLEDYLPEFSDLQVMIEKNGEVVHEKAVRSIRIKDLFMMTSGLTYGGTATEVERQVSKVMELVNEGNYPNDKTPVRALSEALATVPLAFQPGDSWKYGLSHDVLGALIEVISGKTFGQFLKDELFNPLNMNDTFFLIPEVKRNRLSKLYNRSENGSLTVNTTMDERAEPGPVPESGGAGLFSTLSDYSRFAEMLANGGELDGSRILSRNTIRLMASNHLSEQQRKTYDWDYLKGYGYGLGVRTMVDLAEAGSNGAIGEFGWSGLAGTWVLVDPVNQLSAVYMQQMLPNFEAIHQPRLRNVIYGLME
ncbi:serine hydrolase domain-containing protein [Aquibacillus salsiterrae]|uniref:Beta-lactamase family protein n=1 Tax=Aquibacillus salsiterrae TaxID=2950439 RepID=A0A9X4AEZ5_9BACI|nr:serine hydrolase domain-containing protein [Aquibacillus salsiterrae]MDC3417341.1 beta-lactamase family protein [Aquibacillus salsiterrae]